MTDDKRDDLRGWQAAVGGCDPNYILYHGAVRVFSENSVTRELAPHRPAPPVRAVAVSGQRRQLDFERARERTAAAVPARDDVLHLLDAGHHRVAAAIAIALHIDLTLNLHTAHHAGPRAWPHL